MIDLTLNSLLVPDILGYTPPFGQKVVTTPENKGGLSTQQVNDNILLPFATQRAIAVTATDTTSKIERDARLVITGDNVKLTISGDAFAGCKLSILATKSANVVINDTPFTMAQGSSQDVIYTGDKWIGLYPVVGETVIQYANTQAPSELYMATTWQNISSQFAGQFFRAEGGNAVAFGSSQSQSTQPHTHSFSGTTGNMSGQQNAYWLMTGNKNGAGCDNVRITKQEIESSNSCSWIDHNNIKYTLNLQHTHTFSGTTGSYGSTETRPVNSTIRIWKRTA